MENKTAVEWLVEQIFGEHTKEWKKEIRQALAMEKKQIIDAVESARQEDFWDSYNLYEDYYNKKFKKNLHDSKRKSRRADCSIQNDSHE